MVLSYYIIHTGYEKMKILYFAGLHSAAGETPAEQSAKFKVLQKYYNVTAYNYKNMHQPDDIYFEYFDAYIGSSFGGFYAIHLGSMRHKKAIGINPSIHLHTRIDAHKNVYKNLPDGLDSSFLNLFIDKAKQGSTDRTLAIINTDDDVLDIEKNLNYCLNNNIRYHLFNRGGHAGENFEIDIFPLIRKELLR